MMKIALVVPRFDEQRGNTVTVKRIAGGLNEHGIKTSIINSTAKNSADSPVETDLFHGFHAYRFAQFRKKATFNVDPFVITMTGTDLNHDLFDENRKEDVITTLEAALAIHVFNEQAKQIVSNALPSVRDKVYVIPQAVTPFTISQSRFEKEAETFLFILPAGLRKVKNIQLAIRVLDTLRSDHPEVRLWLVGPELEQEEAKHILQLVEYHKEWISYLGTLPHAEMGALLSQGDVVLNTSISEGQPSAILEAMSFGVVPIVSDNEGNKSIVTNAQTGFIFQTEREFLQYCIELINSPDLLHMLGKNSKDYIEQYHSLQQEIDALTHMYTTIFEKRS